MRSETYNTILFEILRDCWQVISLIFSSVSNDLSSFFGKYWIKLWSVCFSCWLENESIRRSFKQYMFIFEAIIAIIATIIFYFAARADIKLDTELQTIEMQRATRDKRKRIYITLLVMTSLYLPLMSSCFSILFCFRQRQASKFLLVDFCRARAQLSRAALKTS